MRSWTSFLSTHPGVIESNALHFFSVGFEDRCLAYPRALALDRRSAQTRTIYTVNEAVPPSLRIPIQSNRGIIKDLFPASPEIDTNHIVDEVLKVARPCNVFLDISSLQRKVIFSCISKLLDLEDVNLHVVYSFPKAYNHSRLQSAHHTVDYVYNDPIPASNRAARLVIIPGFDVEYVDNAMARLESVCGTPEMSWLIPFPGREYIFFERVVEAHSHLLDGNYELLPQENINESARIVFDELSSSGADLDNYVLPIGSRITCIPVLLATIEMKRLGHSVNVMLPKTRRYSTARSFDYHEPLVGRIQKLTTA